MVFQFGNTLAEIHAEATRTYYTQTHYRHHCSCLGCQNFRQWTKYCPTEIQQQFHDFGIDDMNQIIDVIPFGTKMEDYRKHDGMLYGGFYQVSGEVIHSGNNADWKLADNFAIFIPEYLSPTLPDFPKPVLQIEICAYLPWMLAAPMEKYIH